MHINFVSQIESCETVNELRELAMNNIDSIVESGFNKPIAKLELSDRVNIVKTMALHKVILTSLAELTQLREGLSALGVAEALHNHSEALKYFYCLNTNKQLTAG